MTDIEQQIAAIMLHYLPAYPIENREQYNKIYGAIKQSQLSAYNGKMIANGLLSATGKEISVTVGGKKVLANILKGF